METTPNPPHARFLHRHTVYKYLLFKWNTAVTILTLLCFSFLREVSVLHGTLYESSLPGTKFSKTFP